MPRLPSLPSSTLKKRKIRDESSSQRTTVARIQSLESDLFLAVSSKSSLNALADLLETAENEANVQVLIKIVYALYRVFVVIINNGLLTGSIEDESTKVVRTWLQERLHEYVDLLIGLLKDEDITTRVSPPPFSIP